MIIFDGVIFSLQRMGGISVLFKEVIRRMPSGSCRVVGFREMPPPGLGPAEYEARSARRLERYRRADFGGEGGVFHSTYYRLPARNGPKVVTTVYDFVYERYATWPRRIVHSAQKRQAVAKSDRIICISENTRRDLLEFMGHQYESRTVVIPLAAADTFHPLGGAQRRPQVLFVGSRADYKNFDAVMLAVSRLPELTLMIVGGGSLTAHEQRLLTLHLHGRFHAVGYLADDALNAEYNRSLCLAYPSLYEGFGIPILEAMRAGCPVVAFNGSSIPEVAGDAALLLERGTADEIAAQFARLLHGKLRDDLVTRGLARGALFTWDATAAHTAAVYEALSPSPHSKPR